MPQGQAKPAGRAALTVKQRQRCPGRGGAKHSIGVYGMDFYAGPVLPQGTRRGAEYQVEVETSCPRTEVGRNFRPAWQVPPGQAP